MSGWSAIDKAMVIKSLIAEGLPKARIRTMFPGTNKGTVVPPASNAWLNMMLSFLEFPKPIQQKIHDGGIGVKAAYKLTKLPPEKQLAVIERVEREREGRGAFE